MTSAYIEQLIRRHLRRQAAAPTPPPNLARLLAGRSRHAASHPASLEGERRERRFLRTATLGLAAAGILIAIALASEFSPSAWASPESLLKDVRRVQAEPIDRCYLVETVWTGDGTDSKHSFPAAPRTTRLWTRGSRFWAESLSARRLSMWGCDSRGVFWLAVSKNSGMRFDKADPPDAWILLRDLYSVQLETIVDEVLRDFDLRRDSNSASAESGTTLIRATSKADREVGIRSALLEIDERTKVVRRFALDRQFDARRSAIVTFVLVESGSQDESHYELEGHLEPPYHVRSPRIDLKRRRAELEERLRSHEIGDPTNDHIAPEP